MSELIRHLLPHRSALLSVAAFSAVINLLMLVPAVYMLHVYDRVLSTANLTTLSMLTLMALGLYLLLSILEWVRSLLLIRVSDEVDETLSLKVYNAGFAHRLKVGAAGVADNLGDVAQVRQFMTGTGLIAFLDAPWFPLFLLIIFLFHPLLGTVAAIGAMLILGLAAINQLWSKQSQKQASAYALNATHLARDHFRHGETIAAMGMLPALRHRWHTQYSLGANWLAHGAERGALMNSASKGVRVTLQSLMLGCGAYLAVRNEISPGMMIAGSILTGRMLAPLEQVVNAWRQWGAVRQSCSRLEMLIESYPEKEKGFNLPAPKGALSVESVSLIPPGASSPSLFQVDFSLAPGEVLGVIGASGSGKSSLARLLTGVWGPHLGKVRLDGSEFQQWDQQALGQYIGYLPQEISIFQGTVYDNIARFTLPEEAGAEEHQNVIEASQQAGLHEIILRLPEGYNTVLGPDGAGLSGGQKQLLGLARALYGKPSLIVLDEPNSSLDETGEKSLSEALKSLREAKKTVVLISHRAAILQHTTRILVLKTGRVQSFGVTSEVLQTMNGPKKAASTKSIVANTSPFSFSYSSALPVANAGGRK